MKFAVINWTRHLLFGALLTASSVQAIDLIQAEKFLLKAGETQTNELWLSANQITIRGEIANDLFTTSPLIDLSGTFQGDVWCAGDSVIASGIFLDQARAAGRSIQISGTFHKSVTAIGSSFFGNTLKIDPSAKLEKNLFCFAETVIAEGIVSGNTRIIAQKVTLGGTTQGDLSITAQDIAILPNAIIHGDLSYTAPKELFLPASALLDGELIRIVDPAPTFQLFKPNLIRHFLSGIAALLTGLVFIGLFPTYVENSLTHLKKSRGLCSTIGFVALFALPLIAILLLVTVIGLPLSLLIFLSYGILLYLSKIIVALWIGSALLRRTQFIKKTAAAPLALGLLILYTLGSLLVASIFISMISILFGLGALLIALFKKTDTIQLIKQEKTS